MAEESGKRFGGLKPSTAPASTSKKSRASSPLSQVKRRLALLATEIQEIVAEIVESEKHLRKMETRGMLWFKDGYTVEDWHCEYDCQPTQLPSGITHRFDCPFWDATGKTPF